MLCRSTRRNKHTVHVFFGGGLLRTHFIFHVLLSKPLFGVPQGQCLRLHIQKFESIGKTELICPQLYFNQNHRTIIRMQHYSLAMIFFQQKITLDLQGTNLFYIKSQQTKTTNFESFGQIIATSHEFSPRNREIPLFQGNLG